MPSTDLHALVERLEAASEADRELDFRVLAGLFPEQMGVSDGHQGHTAAGTLAAYEGTDYLETCATCFDTPPFTASIDAALALVERVRPERHDWQFGYLSLLKGRQYWARLYSVDGGFHDSKEWTAATLPLAILTALLRSEIAHSQERG